MWYTTHIIQWNMSYGSILRRVSSNRFEKENINTHTHTHIYIYIYTPGWPHILFYLVRSITHRCLTLCRRAIFIVISIVIVIVFLPRRRWKIYSRFTFFSSDSEFLANLEKMFLLYCIYSDVFCRFKYPTTQCCVTRRKDLSG